MGNGGTIIFFRLPSQWELFVPNNMNLLQIEPFISFKNSWKISRPHYCSFHASNITKWADLKCAPVLQGLCTNKLSRQMTSKWRRCDVIRRIDISTTSFRRYVPAWKYLEKLCTVIENIVFVTTKKKMTSYQKEIIKRLTPRKMSVMCHLNNILLLQLLLIIYSP